MAYSPKASAVANAGQQPAQPTRTPGSNASGSPAPPPAPAVAATTAAPHFSSVAFPSEPLSITVVPLRRPEMFLQSHAAEFTEPGDLLHDVLNPISASSAKRTMWPMDVPQVLSTVSFPLKDNATRYLVGEMYRATLVIHNSSPFEVRQISAAAVAHDPRSGKKQLLDFADKVLAPQSTLESRLEGLDLSHEGRHSINVLVHYADPTRAGEIRNVTRTVPITVTHGTIAEDVQVVTIPPYLIPLGDRVASALATQSPTAAMDNGSFTGDAAADQEIAALVEQRLHCSATLMNTSGGPLHLTEVVFKKSGGNQQHDIVTVVDICDVPKMLQRDGLFMPGERRSFMFEVIVTPTSTSSLFNPQMQLQAAAEGKSLELGTLRWGWRRPNGDGGHGASRPFFRALNPLATPSTPSAPAGVARPGTSPTIAAAALAATGAQMSPLVVRFVRVAPSPVRVAEPCTVTFALGNLNATKPVEVVANINADRLLPRFAYNGLTHVHVGLIAPRSVVTLQLELLPLLGGKNVIDGSCLELRDLKAAGASLWPDSNITDDAGSLVVCVLHVTTGTGDDETS